jgi:hypothetical protein
MLQRTKKAGVERATAGRAIKPIIMAGKATVKNFEDFATIFS